MNRSCSPFLAALLLCVSPACSGAPPIVYNPSEPVPTAIIEGVVNAEGKGDVRVDGPLGPLATLYAWEGNVTLRIRSEKPWLVFEQNFEDTTPEPVEEIDAIVEPTPGNEERALQAVENGDVVILRKGKPSQLDAPGSIERRRASRTFPAPQPETPKPPEPVSLNECPNGCCELPPPCFPATSSYKEVVCAR